MLICSKFYKFFKQIHFACSNNPDSKKRKTKVVRAFHDTLEACFTAFVCLFLEHFPKSVDQWLSFLLEWFAFSCTSDQVVVVENIVWC